MRKTFTLTEAQELCSILRREINELRPIYSRLKGKWQTLADRHGLNLEDTSLRELCLENEEARELLLDVEESLYFFKELGVECKGIDQGLFNFPCLIEDRLVFLSWGIDEGEVSHWHEVDADYDGRRPLFEATRHYGSGEERIWN